LINITVSSNHYVLKFLVFNYQGGYSPDGRYGRGMTKIALKSINAKQKKAAHNSRTSYSNTHKKQSNNWGNYQVQLVDIKT
jgi:hypothetical protein